MKWFTDTETTGLKGPAVEIALVPEKGEGWSTLIKQDIPIEEGARAVHGITMEECRAKGMDEASVATMLVANLKDGDEVWAHNVPFDKAKIEYIFAKVGKPMPKVTWHDTLDWARKVFSGSRKLEDLARRLGFKVGGHRALGDALACRELFFKLTEIHRYSLKQDDYVKVVGPRIVWGTMYHGEGKAPEFKEFEVRSVDFKSGRFHAYDIRKEEMREYRFDRFVKPVVVEAIIKVMA